MMLVEKFEALKSLVEDVKRVEKELTNLKRKLATPEKCHNCGFGFDTNDNKNFELVKIDMYLVGWLAEDENDPIAKNTDLAFKKENYKFFNKHLAKVLNKHLDELMPEILESMKEEINEELQAIKNDMLKTIDELKV